VIDREEHVRRASELAEQALQPGTRPRRAHLLAVVAQVHATLATTGDAPMAPPVQPRRLTPPPALPRSAPAAAPVTPQVVRPGGNPTLFERLKGQDGIATVVQTFYTRVLADPQLAHYFEHVAMWRLQRHMVAFLIQATGGPVAYQGRDLATAHAGKAITGRDFDRVARHLVEALTALGVAAGDVDEVVAAIGPLKQHVVTASESAVDPGRSQAGPDHGA
jgi:hemoglobin